MPRSHHVGRLRVKAAEILQAGFTDCTIDAEDIRPAQGVYRSSVYHDVVRWEAFLFNKRGNPVKSIHSWETLTHFCRNAPKFGFTIGHEGDIDACESEEDMKTVIKKIKKKASLYWRTRYISPDQIKENKKT